MHMLNIFLNTPLHGQYILDVPLLTIWTCLNIIDDITKISVCAPSKCLKKQHIIAF